MCCSYIDFNPMSVVVCSKQYSSSDPEGRGFGDIAHGVRVIQFLRRHTPDKKIGFIVEYYGDIKEKRTIKCILDSNKINYILINEHKKGTQDIIKAKASFWLNKSESIIHGPSSFISIIKQNKKYLSKLLYFEEYETNNHFATGKDIKMPIERMGITRNMLHLVNYDDFKDTDDYTSAILKQVFSIKKLSNNSIYFFYVGSGEGHYFKNTLANILCIEKNNTNDIYVITPVNLDWDYQDHISTIVNKLAYNTEVNIHVQQNNGENFTLEYKISTDRTITSACKNIYYINPFPLSEHDLLKLNLDANYIFANGDISFSDALSAGKIPIINSSKKQTIYRCFNKKLQCLYSDNAIYNYLIAKWQIINTMYSTRSAYGIVSRLVDKNFSCLSSNEWKKLQHEFTKYIKEHNQLEKIILDHVNSAGDMLPALKGEAS